MAITSYAFGNPLLGRQSSPQLIVESLRRAIIEGHLRPGESLRQENLAKHFAVSRIPVLANTGVNHDTVGDILALVDGAIVGTSLKVDGNTWNRVDPDRARRMVELVAAARG